MSNTIERTATTKPAISGASTAKRTRNAAAAKSVKSAKPVKKVLPSIVDPDFQKPFTMDQELVPFGTWADKPVWVPPKDYSRVMAQTMLKKHGLFTAKDERWSTVFRKHRSDFTQVREIDLPKASIRLPQGKFFVTVTEQKDFGYITDKIPACVQTRLDEFLEGPGKRPGVKVSYLKPLCIEVDDELILTSREDLMAAVDGIQKEVMSEYWRLYLLGLPRRIAAGIFNGAMAIPKRLAKAYMERQKRAVDIYHAKLEFRRRKLAYKAAKTHRKIFAKGCSFEEMSALTGPLKTEDVVELYGEELELSKAQRQRLIRMAAGSLPWFAMLSIGATSALSAAMAATTPVLVVDPVFVAEMPGRPGVLLKIGHFDEVAGVTHVEI